MHERTASINMHENKSGIRLTHYIVRVMQFVEAVNLQTIKILRDLQLHLCTHHIAGNA
jgi:hypothetical protein